MNVKFIVSKSCDECKGSFLRGCEAKRWSHWTCSSLGTIFQPVRINSVPDVKRFCNNKNVLHAQSMVWHFVRHTVYIYIYIYNLHIMLLSSICEFHENRCRDITVITRMHSPWTYAVLWSNKHPSKFCTLCHIVHHLQSGCAAFMNI